MLNLKRAVVSGALMCAVALGLTGCTPDNSPRVRMEEGVPVIALCAEILAAEVEVLVGADGSDPAEGSVYWRVTGSHTFTAGDLVVVGVVPEGMTQIGSLGSFDPTSDDLIVNINPVQAGADIQTRWLAAGAVPDDKWSNGNSLDAPCG